MSTMLRHHQELDENGEGKCSRPMWSGYGMPAGFCDQPAFGPQRPRRWPGEDLLYVPALACPGHGGPASADEAIRMAERNVSR